MPSRGGKATKRSTALLNPAKLDFLLRYPSYLEKALLARKAPEAAAQVEEFERNSVEARMVRYKFGPWDYRYRRFLNVLVGKGFVEVKDGRPVVIRLTPKGRTAAASLLVEHEYRSVRHRAGLLKQHLNLGGRTLMEFIYKTFPEVTSLRLGETINQWKICLHSLKLVCRPRRRACSICQERIVFSRHAKFRKVVNSSTCRFLPWRGVGANYGPPTGNLFPRILSLNNWQV